MLTKTRELLAGLKSTLKKIKTVVFISATLLLLVVNTTELKAQFAGGTGTEEDPYQISTIEQLDSVRLEPGYNVFFVLLNDINASSTRTWNEGKGFLPIGGQDLTVSNFRGHFDGQGFTIDSLYMNNPGYQSIGLFGYLQSQGTISNIKLTNYTLIGNTTPFTSTTLTEWPKDWYVGGLVGINEGTISNSHVTGKSIGVYVGGLAAVNAGSIDNSSAFVEIDSSDTSGGIASVNVGLISESNATGTIRNGRFAGGLVGMNVNNRSVQYVNFDGKAIISNSLSSVNINNTNIAGGLAGINSVDGIFYGDSLIISRKAIITNSYSMGSVIGNEQAGGIAAENSGIISFSYSNTLVSGGLKVGGLVADHGRGIEGEVINSFWDTETSGQLMSVGGEGKTTAEMTKKSTFLEKDWDYRSVWVQRPSINDGYPQLDVAVGAGVDPGVAPVVSEVTVSGSFVAGEEMRVSYNYTDTDEDFDRSAFQWYRYDDLAGTNKTVISGAEGMAFIPTSEEIGKYINVEVTPKDFFLAGSPFGSEIVGSFTVPFTGEGTKESPYEISTLAQLQSIGQFLAADFKLMNNIDASLTKTWNDGAGFIPIGSTQTPFSGSLDGQNFAIDSLFIEQIPSLYLGLFAIIDTLAEVSNLTLHNSTINGGTENQTVEGFVAGVVGNLAGANAGTIYNVNTDGEISGYSLVGGLVASNRGTGSIKKSSVEGVVIGSRGVGGFVGTNTGLIDSSNTHAYVEGSTNVGGFAGQLTRLGEIKNSYATGNVKAYDGNSTGGFAGFAAFSAKGISESYATGDVSGDKRVGGLVGTSQSSIKNSYATGFIDGDEDVGGLIGFNFFGEVSHSYSTGLVQGSEKVGGLIGSVSGGEVSTSFWDTETSTQLSSAGGEGKTTSEMQMQATYEGAGWDFTNIWDIEEGTGYPFHRTDSMTVSNEPQEDLPVEVKLFQNYPNPFNPSTTISFSVPKQSRVTLEVFDMLGRKVAKLIDGEIRQAGRYSMQFNASALSSGMYFYRLEAEGKFSIQKMTLIK